MDNKLDLLREKYITMNAFRQYIFSKCIIVLIVITMLSYMAVRVTTNKITLIIFGIEVLLMCTGLLGYAILDIIIIATEASIERIQKNEQGRKKQ